jgi:ribosomal protein S18 acetylase RimI-like enzyme
VSPASPSSASELTGGFVRPAREGDADDLARVQVASWRSGLAGIVPSALLAELTSEEATAVWRDRWREAIASPPTSRHRVLTAVTGALPREVVGFVSAGPATDADRWPGTDAEIYELRVSPERTGEGHDSRLVHAAADTLVGDGFQTVSICGSAAFSRVVRLGRRRRPGRTRRGSQRAGRTSAYGDQRVNDFT